MGAYVSDDTASGGPDQPFSYDATIIPSLVAALSPTRFATYREAAGTDRRALQLYAWNTSVSGAFYGPLQTFEVALRNAVDGAISATHGERWFDDPTVLRPSDNRMVGDVVQRIYDAGKQPVPGRVIAELGLGFWVGLFANAYDQTLWRSHLHRLFNPRVRDRRALHDSMDRLRTLRNRVAHHEPIFRRRLSDDNERLLALVGSLTSPTRLWLEHHSSVPTSLSTPPDRLERF